MSGFELNLHSFLLVSEVNGPGRRSVFWSQGCNRNCPGCINPDAGPVTPNLIVSVEEAFAKIPLKQVEGITISGGEPFLQPEPFARLAKLCRDAGLHVMVYSGFTLEELNGKSELNFLKYIDLLIDGSYEAETAQTHPWAGSGNQRIHDFSKSIKMENSDFTQGEVHISPNGEMIFTGILNERDYL